MQTHTVTLTLQVQADTTADALDFGLAAGVHLLETFNDDDSIAGTIGAEVKPAPLALDQPDTPENCARFEAIGGAIAHGLSLPRIRTGPDRGRYITTHGTKTAQGLGRIVARIVEETRTA